MIYLSAQPDDFYFTWQLELQIYNFNKLGIPAENIHVLISHSCKRGLNHFFKDLIQKHRDKANFFVYPDTRKKKKYASSIRPHIIRKHLIKYSYLKNENIFYHDADIIFTELPDFDSMIKDDLWYVSDTRDYLDSAYIKNHSNEDFFESMCKIVGIQPTLVTENDLNCGGAQYLLKNTCPNFWAKVERDSENLFSAMELYNNQLSERLYLEFGKKRLECPSIQSWCADMWAVFWNALKFGKKVRINKELNFLLAKSPMEELRRNKILHYSGDRIGVLGPIFSKTKYYHYPPFYDITLNHITSNTVSHYLVNLIKEYRDKLDEAREDLSDVTFLMPVRIDSESRLENLYTVCAYINKYFKTNIFIAELDSESKFDRSLLPKNCTIFFLKDESRLMHRTYLNNYLIQKSTTEILAIIDTDVVIPIQQILDSVNRIRGKHADMVSPYNGEFVAVTNLFKPIFAKVLDADLLVLNKSAFTVTTKRSYGGIIFFKKDAYVDAGMENEFFISWGPEDVERVKRMRNLGYRVERTKGALFHLPHEVKENSQYHNDETFVKFMQEYLKVCNMDKNDLKVYIKSWPWNKYLKYT